MFLLRAELVVVWMIACAPAAPRSEPRGPLADTAGPSTDDLERLRAEISAQSGGEAVVLTPAEQQERWAAVRKGLPGDLSGFAVIDRTAPRYATSTAAAKAAAWAGNAGNLAVAIVADHGDVLEVRTLAERHCAQGDRSPLDELEMTFFVQQSAAMPVLSRAVTRTETDGTAIDLAAGLPLQLQEATVVVAAPLPLATNGLPLALAYADAPQQRQSARGAWVTIVGPFTLGGAKLESTSQRSAVCSDATGLCTLESACANIVVRPTERYAKPLPADRPSGDSIGIGGPWEPLARYRALAGATISYGGRVAGNVRGATEVGRETRSGSGNVAESGNADLMCFKHAPYVEPLCFEAAKIEVKSR